MAATRTMLTADTLRNVANLLDRLSDAAEDNDLKLGGRVEVYDADNNKLGDLQFAGFGGSFVATWDD